MCLNRLRKKMKIFVSFVEYIMVIPLSSQKTTQIRYAINNVVNLIERRWETIRLQEWLLYSYLQGKISNYEN